MSEDLMQRIREAEAIETEQSRKEQIRAELPELRAQLARQQAEDQARETLTAVRADVSQTLAAYRARLGPWREAFSAYLQEGERLAGMLAELEAGIPEAARALAGAIGHAQRAGVPTEHVAGAWCSLGWCDPDLQAVPNRGDGRVFRVVDFDEKLAALLAEKAGARVYEPRAGIRGAGVRA